MKNKFLEKYPQLREPRIGDCIKVTRILNADGSLCLDVDGNPKTTNTYFKYGINDIGYIYNIGTNTHNFKFYTIKFKNKNNASVYKDEFIIINKK